MKRTLTQYLLLCILWCKVVCVAAESSIAIISDLDKPFDLTPFIEYLEDPHRILTYEQLRQPKQNLIWINNATTAKLGKNSSVRYWFRFSIQLPEHIRQTEPRFYIPGQPHLIYKLNFWLPSDSPSDSPNDRPSDNKTARVLRTGYLRPFNQRDEESLFYTIKAPLLAQTYEVMGYIDNLNSGISANFPLFLATQKQWQDLVNKNNFILVAFYSIFAALLVYNLFLFITIRQRLYGYYLLFLLTAATMCAVIDGTLSRWILPMNPILHTQLGSLNGFLISGSYLLFTWTALEYIAFSPALQRIFKGLFILFIIAVLHNILHHSYYLQIIIPQWYSMIVMATCLITVITASIKKIPVAKYLLVAEIFFITGGSNYNGLIRGVVALSEINSWSLHYGILAEALLLSLAVAARTNIAIQDKLSAQALAYENERKAVAALELATQTKNQFLTTVSHELRTPLNSIIGFSGVLLDDPTIRDANRDHARTILNNGKQLLAIVNDVLNLSLIESQRISITQSTINPRSLIEGLEAIYRIAAHKKQLDFRVIIDNDLPHLIEIDDDHLSQILKQLLDNAFKFTHQGQITLTVNNVLDTFAKATDSRLQFTLMDTGIGIAADKLSVVFEPFTQADSSNTRRYSGTGVGLYIVKSLCEKMGGTLVLKSTEGVGTRVELIMPYNNVIGKELPTKDSSEQSQEQSPRNALAKSQTPQLRGRVLYAEDNLDNQQLVKLYVAKTGAELMLVENGRAAIEAINNALLSFDLVLMDLQMPVMDGYEATANLKRNGCKTPVVACSASALADVTQKSEVVFDGYLGKPIDKIKLYAVLAEFLEKNP